MAPGTLALRGFFRQTGYTVLAAVDEVVMPTVRQVIADPARQAQIGDAFRTSAVKFGAGIWSYSRMVGMPFPAGLAALSTAFTRLYDDLMDLHADDGMDERFQQLFEGAEPCPASDLESLAYRLFQAAQESAGRSVADGIYADLRLLHQWQVRSRGQRGGRLSEAELMEITAGKGGLGLVVLFGLAHPGITTAQREVVLEAGIVGQMLDDQHDLPVDRLDGISTPATTGRLNAWQLAGRTARLGRRLRLAYGRKAAPLTGLFFLYQMGLIFRSLHVTGRYRPLGGTPWKILTGRTHDIPPLSRP